MKIESKLQLEHRLNNCVKQRIKDRINERITVHIKNFQNKNKTIKSNTSYSLNQEKFNKLKNNVFNNNTKFKTNSQ